jgi:hypothetical protein
MANIRYLEIDSTYRDRNRFPLPSNFEVDISQTGTKDRYTAIDPVSLAAPITSWTSGKFDQTLSSYIVSCIVSPIVPPNNYVGGTDTPSVFIIQAPAGHLQKINDYYVGAVINDTNLIQMRRIEQYYYLGTDAGGINDRAQIYVERYFGDSFNRNDIIEIYDPTDFSNPSVPLVFVPNGRTAINGYIKNFLYNETLNQYRPIIGYDVFTHLLELDTTGVTSTSSGPVIGWTKNDNYCIRKEVPILTGTIGAGATITTVPLGAGASNVTSFYNRQFLRMTSGTQKNIIPMITSYNGTARTATIYPPFSVAPVAGDTYEILTFSYDNSVPFSYSGSLVSQQEEVCYEIELIDLILPNKTLNVGRGSRAAFYTYMYIEFSNVSGASAGMHNVIYSNNPNSTRMLIRSCMDDIQDPLRSSFVKVDGNGMTQVVKFKPNDSIRFSVRLPNGQFFETQKVDSFSPYAPNDELQISAVFSLKRL